jgi:hypothetical protein
MGLNTSTSILICVYTPKLNAQYINPLETEGQKQREENNYRKDYPLYGTTRLRKSILARINDMENMECLLMRL